MNPVEYYQKHLDRVSRSFAYCIGRLDAPLRGWVSLTYLICRILDTVEDARWARMSDQLQRFEQFRHFLLFPESARRLEDWSSEFPDDVPAGEKALLREAGEIFSDVHELPTKVRAPIQDLVLSMATGMRYFAEKRVQGWLKLSGLKEVNQYCFFVAGIVGEALANLFSSVDERISLSRELIRDSHHFGLFLQKVNLLKDQFKDESEGRFLVPERERVFASLSAHVRGALRYVQAIPCDQKSYRTFCLSSLFLGLGTLPLLRQQGRENLEPKLSRAETMALFTEIEKRADDPAWVQEQGELLLEAADLANVGEHVDQGIHRSADTLQPDVVDFSADDSWIAQAYRGFLKPSELAALGVV